MSESGDADETPLETLRSCLADPARGKRRLPAIVGLLEADDEHTRLAAAWTCCLVAVEYPDTVEYVVRRLADRLGEGTVSLELTHALDYLLDRYPAQVEAVLDDVVAEADDGAGRSDVTLPQPGRFTRSFYQGYEPDRRGVGRVRYPDQSGADDPRRTYTTGSPDERERAQRRQRDADDGPGEGTGTDQPAAEAADADRGAQDPADAGGDAQAPADAGGDGAQGPATDRHSHVSDVSAGELVWHRPAVSAIAARSRFDQLHILATYDRGRYAEDYRALVGRGSDRRAVTLRLLHLPDEQGAHPAFEDGVRDALDQWTAVDDHDHVLSLLDWGLEPRPWLATAVPGETLATQDLDGPRALSAVIALADAVAHLHRNDVVHGGIDPETVAYPRDVLEDDDQDPPLLNDVGLLSVYRFHVDPATVLDPRFAAPEYYDRAFGRVDAATDVYHLGALVFSLFAGRPPYDGSVDQVRAAVTDERVPVPGDVASGVPERVDEVVRKAMAPRKLTRYEAVEHLQQDLVGIREADVL